MLEIRHRFNKDKQEIYTAIYLNDQLLIDWTPEGLIEINSIHPEVKIAKHINSFQK